jgi:spore maturation protein CgeB
LDKVGLLNAYLKRPLIKTNAMLLERVRAFKPDYVFVVKGEILFPETLVDMRKVAPLVSYHWDDPFLQYAKKQDATRDIRYQNINHSYDKYEHTFVYDESYIGPLKESGAKNVTYLMDWYEPEIYKSLDLSADEKKKWGSDIAFVGSPYPNRIAILGALREFDVAVWGPEFRWREHFAQFPFLQKQYRGEAPGADAVKIYNASKIALNIHDTFQCFSSVNNRTFQILASGAAELVDDRERLHALFRVGEDLFIFKDATDVAKKAGELLANPDKIKKMAASGHAKSAGHSATERARFILEKIS